MHAAITLRSKLSVVEEQSHSSKLVIRAAEKAARLSQLSKTTQIADISSPQRNVYEWHQAIPAHPIVEGEVENATMSASVDVKFDDAWKSKYEAWQRKVYVDASTHTPTAKQQYVLDTIHWRILKEEYETLQEDYAELWRHKPQHIHVDSPLLRLIHGLPGSGKSQLLL